MAGTFFPKEEKLFRSKITDMIRLSEKRGCVWSLFMDGREMAAAKEVLNFERCRYKFYGVFDEADRQMLCVYDSDGYFEPQREDFPITLLTFKYRQENKLTHRDFLGALMSLGIKRETVGDIAVSEGMTQAAVTDTAAELILGSVSKIGSVGVKCVKDSLGNVMQKQQDYKEIVGTVPSLRLDAVVGTALGLSRAKTAEIIKAVGADVNYEEKHDCSYNLKETDVFSVRGYGKFRLSAVSGITKKGRIHISILKYC